ncbi:MAG: nucleoside/nucleotide kinase family protein [Comamonadaceae bacterium]|nr:nucleoside/nucleotide kinase family protein [Comamonadaceae bacterium]
MSASARPPVPARWVAASPGAARRPARPIASSASPGRPAPASRRWPPSLAARCRRRRPSSCRWTASTSPTPGARAPGPPRRARARPTPSTPPATSRCWRGCARADATVWAPEYRRGDSGEAVAGAIAVPPQAPLVVTEGNYLLLADGAVGRRARRCSTSVWYVEVDDALRRERLAARHRRHGRSAADAAADWVGAAPTSRTRAGSPPSRGARRPAVCRWDD